MMNLIKSFKPIFSNALYSVKFFDGLKYFQKKRVSILMYHRFSDHPDPFKIEVRGFEAQIKFLKSKYNIVSLDHYVAFANGLRNDLPDNSVVITIDDGYRDNYEFAYPVLKKYNVPATIFLCTDFISKKSWLWANKLEYILMRSKIKEFDFNIAGEVCHLSINNFSDWHRTQLKIFFYCAKIDDTEKESILKKLSDRLDVDCPKQTCGDYIPLSWSQIREMHQDRIFFGAHTCSHPILTKIGDAKLEYELSESKKVIEKELGCSVSSFCYPDGKYDDRVINAVQKTGYSCAVITDFGFNQAFGSNLFALNRLSYSQRTKFNMYRDLTRF